MEDLGSPDEICEMCEVTDIRYVHHMQHPDYAEVLKVGCICAGNMEEDLEGAQRRERSMKSAARRRKAWPTRKAWKLSQNGNFHIYESGYHVTIFRKGDGWGGVISNDAQGIKKFARQTYADSKLAMLAAFDSIIWLQNRKPV
ncbi:MAG: hypothetical protein AB7V46_13400 [Thermomicrobiales bacterium]